MNILTISQRKALKKGKKIQPISSQVRKENALNFNSHIARDALRRTLITALLFVSGLGITKGSTSLALFQLPPHPEQEQITEAKKAFAQNGIVAMKNGDPKVLGGILNVAFPETPVQPGEDDRGERERRERVCIVAAHRSPDGVVHRFVGGPASRSDASKEACETYFRTWVRKQDGSSVGDAGSGPDPSAWTQVAEYEIGSGDKYGNYFSETLQVYRANLNNVNDYYMVTKTPSSSPRYYGKCDAVAGCGWIHNHRWLNIGTDGNFPLVSHGPLNQITSSSASLSVGLDTGGPSFGYSTSWSQDSVTTVDNTPVVSNATTAVWREDFYDWSGTVTVPLTSQASFYSQQAAIFQVPAGTTSFNVVMTDQAEFRYYGELQGQWVMQNNYSMVHLNYKVPVSAPVFNVSAPNETVIPGSSGEIQVYANLPSSGAGLNWQIVDQPSWLSTTIVPEYWGGTIQFNVDSTQATPQVGYLHINTTVPNAAPTVRDGHPLTVTFNLSKKFVSKAEVLITGGADWGGVSSFTAEVWDPATKTVAPTLNTMSTARQDHTATALADGRVLIAGGFDDSGNEVNTTDIFDPSTGLFTPGPNMLFSRAFHTATRLSDGTVLIAGGLDSHNVALGSAELYDPTTNSFTRVGDMYPAQQHTANLLWDGTVLVEGGTSGNANDWGFGQAMVYNPSTRSFRYVGGLTEGRYGQFSSMLPGGLVFVAGGINPIHNPVSTAEIFTGMSMSFYYQTNMDVARKYETGALLANDQKILLAGGAADGTSASLFDVATNTFSRTGSMGEQRDHPAGVLLQGTNTSLEGQFLVVGGVVPNTGGSGGRSLETYNPNTGTWFPAGQMSMPRASATATLCLPGNTAN